MNHFDFWIFKNGDLAGVVALNNRKHLVLEEAVKHYTSIFAERNYDRYFLLVSQDYGYLWTPSSVKEYAEPAVEFSMRQIVSRYFMDFDPESRLRGYVLHMIVCNWLYDLVSISEQSELEQEPEKVLAPTGFLSHIQGAVIRSEVGS